MLHSTVRNTISHRTRFIALLSATALVAPSFAQSLPSGGTVSAGNAVIGGETNGAITIDQTSANAVINWQSFNIGAGNAVNFVQPDAASAILNRVTGATTTSIAGQLNANGQVYLINPNGIAITATGTVNTGAFVASTLGISDDAFMAGGRTFTGNGASAAVTNAGTITIERGGYLALIGGSVANSGTITVPMGKAALGSGEQATLDLSGDGFLQVAIPTHGQGSDALVSNSGTISANGGMVQLSAAAARDAARQAVNMSGTVEARGVSGRNGDITLFGGEGKVVVTGRLITRNTSTTSTSGGEGGSITVASREIEMASAIIDASGTTGGGAIHIGGERQGGGTLPHAETLSVDANTTINADAISTGNGGDVVLWSDSLTRFSGTISAKGGALSGNGGQAEVSGKARLAYTGFTDLSAANGAFGTLLLDPYNVTISNGADTGGFTATGNDSVINAATLQTALSGANVTVSTGNGGAQAGDITVAAPLSWGANTLTLDAYHSITINAPLTVAGTGGLALITNDGGTGGDLSFGLAGSGFSGRVDFTGTPGQQALSINNQAYALLYSMADVENINNDLSGNYALATNLDASPASYASAVVAAVFNGTLEGLGNTISNLTITGNNDNVGLIGRLGATGTIRDLGLVGGSVSGYNFVGGLVGFQAGGTIGNAYATGAVSGDGYVGGLVGYQAGGTISNAHATGAVSGNLYVGGLVGYQDSGTISNAYATGAVSGNRYVGGLVGYQDSGGTISNAYTTGAVSGNLYVGGLVGYQFGGTLSNSYATGAVSGTNSVGGLVGFQISGTISNAYATGAVSGNLYVGGLVGYQYGGTISNSYWDMQTSGQNNAFGLAAGSSTGIAGLTTAAFQSGGAAGLGSAFSGGANGLYPYLTSFYPNGVQAISGFAYTDSGVTKAASGANGPRYVYVDIAGKQTAVTTGANGYYYVAVTNGTLSSANGGTAALAYTLAGNVTGPVAGAHLMAATGTTANVDIWGNTLIAPTTATTLSAAPTDGAGLLAANGSANQTLLTTALGNDTAASVLSNLSLAGYIATGAAGFTIDQGISANGLYVRTTNGPIMVSSAQTLGGPINLELLSAGALAINAPITVNGAGSVTLGYDAGSPANLAFATGASLTFADANGNALSASPGNQSLAINGQAYTLLYSMADVENINTALSGKYALATSIDASPNTAYMTGVVAGDDSSGNPPTPFSGTFEGLGQTIANLTINGGSKNYVGLFGSSTGTVRNIGLTGGSVSGTYFVGGLVGYQGSGTISNAYATGSVSGTFYVGGLVGLQPSGTISNAHATGAVSGNAYVGGLVGGQDSGGTISNAYATGSVSGNTVVGGLVGYQVSGTISNAYATGAVSGTNSYVGGLVGAQDSGGTISNAYATGAVSGITAVGGLVGYQSSGSIANAYATGAVSGSGYVGGLVGFQNGGGTISNGYWDMQTSGQSSSAGGTGLTTVQMQNPFTFIDGGWNFTTVWATPKAGGAPVLRSLTTASVYDYYVRLSGNTTAIYGDTIVSGITVDGIGAANVAVSFGAVNAGTHAYSGSNVLLNPSVGSAGDYFVDYGTGSLIISQRAITVTADALSKIYGNANPALTYSASGLVNNDTLSGSLSTSASQYSNVGL